MDDRPKWLADLVGFLPIRPHIVLTGNFRDIWLADGNQTKTYFDIYQYIWLELQKIGFQALLRGDQIGGIEISSYDQEPNTIKQIETFVNQSDRNCSLCLNPNGKIEKPAIGDSIDTNLAQLARVINAIQPRRSTPNNLPPKVGLIIDLASRIRHDDLFSAAEKAAVNAFKFTIDEYEGYNPVIWLVNQDIDLPYWFTSQNEKVKIISVPLPSLEQRGDIAEFEFEAFENESQYPNGETVTGASFGADLAKLTHNMTANSVRDIVSVALANEIDPANIREAVASYRIGNMNFRSPWQSPDLHDRIANAEATLAEDIKGQSQAIKTVCDNLKRIYTGLSGAQAPSSTARPKGVLFFAGPTGVGKTETAKKIAQIVFGDQSHYLRFDMSEFSAEHAADRLIGSPPGYVGFERGGELTNAIREQPFRVLLFDEIEKGHRLILDKFLQILEDGRLSDGQGRTVYFSDTLIIFTSNLGISEEVSDGRITTRMQKVKWGEIPEEVDKKVRQGIENHFKFQIGRPEILNRIGENITVFHFIEKETAKQIIEKMLGNVKNHAKNQGIEIKFAPSFYEDLYELCLNEEVLSNGGRGIGSRLEKCLINPLSGYIFDNPQTTQLTLTRTIQKDGFYEITC